LAAGAVTATTENNVNASETFCATCGEIGHMKADCPFTEQYDGEFEIEHHHKIARSAIEKEDGTTQQSRFGESVGLALHRALEPGHQLSGDGDKI